MEILFFVFICIWFITRIILSVNVRASASTLIRTIWEIHNDNKVHQKEMMVKILEEIKKHRVEDNSQINVQYVDVKKPFYTHKSEKKIVRTEEQKKAASEKKRQWWADKKAMQQPDQIPPSA